MGMIPLSECSRRRRKECPWPALSGGTPCFELAGAGGLTVVATELLLNASSVAREPFIMLLEKKGSQGLRQKRQLTIYFQSFTTY